MPIFVIALRTSHRRDDHLGLGSGSAEDLKAGNIRLMTEKNSAVGPCAVVEDGHRRTRVPLQVIAKVLGHTS